MYKKIITLFCSFTTYWLLGQVAPSVNSGNPNFPFPQFKSYKGGGITLANKNPIGMPHAELEQRVKDAYTNVCNNMTYNVTQNGTDAPLTVNGVKYIMPNVNLSINHCSCVEADGYYLLAAAYMGDKTTFDGYYMWMHDRQFQKTVRFVDNVMNSPNYAYSPGISGAGSFGNSTNVYGGAVNMNSAGDGDVDVALALLMAWKQWGDDGLICTDAELGAVSYKNEAIKYIRTMADTIKYAPSLPNKKYVTGIIGLDGYMKGGDSWGEETSWANTGMFQGLVSASPGPTVNYVDYHAPAYFHAFAKVMESVSPWCTEQYKRAEASSDWVMGQAYSQGFIPWIGKYQVSGSTVKFQQFVPEGEDFRYGWRTILNYLWNGAPSISWNPSTYQYEVASNTYEKDMATRFATFLYKPEDVPYGNACFTTPTNVSFGGPANLKMSYDMNGKNAGQFTLNHILGPAAPASIVSGNWDLMAQLFRQCVLSWDDSQGSAQRYLTGQPKYFQEWFRLLGMLTLTGNFHDPTLLQPEANMKVYKATDKTFAFYGDTVQFTISYRNYGKPDAQGVLVTDTLPTGVTYLAGSSSKSVVLNGNVLKWNVGVVSGTNKGVLASTKDSLVYKVLIGAGTSSLLAKSASISCTNGTGWTSNEYPNKVSTVMQRNYVDVLGYDFNKRKKASKSSMVVGDTISYTLVVKNNVKTLLNGGRQGVNVGVAHDGIAASKSTFNIKYRFYHGSHEPTINYKNYRVSYFVKNLPAPTWAFSSVINEGSNGLVPTFSATPLPESSNYNQKLTMTFPDVLASYSPFLYERNGLATNVHEGVMQPHRLVAMLNTSNFSNINYTDDWSAETGINAVDGSPYFPIGNDFTDPINPNILVDRLQPNQCGKVTTIVKKQLLEEWDGYTWRRVYGDAPCPMLSLVNRKVLDTLANNLSFVSFSIGYPQGSVSGKSITWPKIANLAPGDSVVYKYVAKIESITDAEDVLSGKYATSVYPNPSSKAFVVEKNGAFRYQLIDSKGMVIEAGNGADQLIIGASLSAGIYLLKIEAEGKNEYMKIEKY